MNLSFLTPVVVSLALTGCMALGAREHHRVIDGVEIYKFPPGIAYLMGFCGLLFLGAPFLPGARGDADPWSFFFFFAAFAAGAVLAAVYFLRYKVMIRTNQLSYGAFFKRTVNLADIVDAKVQRGSRSAQLFVSLRVGRKITFSGMLGDFDSLASEMVSCVVKNKGESSDPATINRMLGRTH